MKKNNLLNLMVVLIVFIPYFFSTFHLNAQGINYQSLKANSKALEIDLAFAPYLEFGRATDQFTLFAGADLSIIINQNLFLGFYAATAPLGFYPDGYSYYDGYEAYFEHAGFLAGYTFDADKIIHPYLQLKSGWGNLAIYDGDWINIGTYIIQPSFGVEMNLNNRFKLFFDLHYRMGAALDLYVYKDGSINGSGVSIGCRYGRFN